MKNLVFILLLFSIPLIRSQNLITNPSFEDIDSCYGQPAGIGFDVFEWSGCTGWSNPIGASSDLWCENPIISSQTPPYIPGLGYQHPRTGENMAGIIVNDGIIINYREYIQNELNSTMESGFVYNVKLYISANGYDCYSNKFGVKFSSTYYDNISELWLTNVFPDAENNEQLFSNDTSVWQKIEMSYIANGTEKYLIIGNFQDSLTTTYTQPCDTTLWGNITYGGGYFFIDDVSIEKAPPFAEVPNVFTPNNDGINDFISPKVYNSFDWEMTIMNRWGNQVAVLNEDNHIWNGLNCPNGVYFYFIKGNENNIEQGFISLFRD